MGEFILIYLFWNKTEVTTTWLSNKDTLDQRAVQQVMQLKGLTLFVRER